MTITVIRDFAYSSNDKRYNGEYPNLTETSKTNKEKPSASEDHGNGDVEDDEEEEDDPDIDYSQWEWSWSYNNSKPKFKMVPPLLEMKNFKLSLLSQLTITLNQSLMALNPPIEIEISHARTIFPFVKGTEYEMSLESPDELLVVSQVTKATSSPPPAAGAERWSSIDDMPSQETQKKDISLILEPKSGEFAHEIQLFLGYNKNYGDGWLTALKVKILGSWEKKSIRLQLLDLGLVPGNYCNLDKIEKNLDNNN